MADARRAMARVMALAQFDPAFRAALVANPRAALVARGVPVPEGVEIRVVESTETVMYLALPPQGVVPSEPLGEERLEAIAGGLEGCGAGEGGFCFP